MRQTSMRQFTAVIKADHPSRLKAACSEPCPLPVAPLRAPDIDAPPAPLGAARDVLRDGDTAGRAANRAMARVEAARDVPAAVLTLGAELDALVVLATRRLERIRRAGNSLPATPDNQK